MRIKAHAVVMAGRVEPRGAVEGLTVIPDRGETASTVFYNGIILLAPHGWTSSLRSVAPGDLMATARRLSADIPVGEPAQVIKIPVIADQ